jgi:phosphate transport system substrate-binding protein
MSQKNQAPAVILSLLITIALVGIGMWWLASRSGANLPIPVPQTSSLPNAPTPKPPRSF